MFAIGFGLSMDYEVFLVSSIHEEWTLQRDTDGWKSGSMPVAPVPTSAPPRRRPRRPAGLLVTQNHEVRQCAHTSEDQGQPEHPQQGAYEGDVTSAAPPEITLACWLR